MSSRESLRKKSARIGYNVGFGSRRHFATYEIIEKVPTYFGVVTFGFGIVFLKYPNTAVSDFIAVLTSIIGGAIVYLNFYANEKDNYEKIGKKLNALYNRTCSIHEKSKTCTKSELLSFDSELDIINDELQSLSIHNQVFFSNELAHFKLFGESQSGWFVEELKLTFWKDKIPAIWRVYAVVVIIITLIFLITSIVINCDVFATIAEFINACKR